MNSQLFTGSNPSLINSKMIQDIQNELQLSDNKQREASLGTSCSNFYNNYISHNSFPLLVFLLIGLYLFIKYHIKKDKESKLLKEQEELKKYKKQLKEKTHYLIDEYKNKLSYPDMSDDIIDDEYSIETLQDNNSNIEKILNPYTDDVDEFINSSNSTMNITDKENKKKINDMAKKLFSN